MAWIDRVSTELGQTLTHHRCVRQTGLSALVQGRRDRCRQCRTERSRLGATDVAGCEPLERLRREIVVAAGLGNRHALTHACERERVVTQRSRVIFGLPYTSSFD